MLRTGIAVGASKHRLAIAPWKIIFIVSGLLTIVVGVIALWALPDNQLNAHFLKSRKDRMLAVQRIRRNGQGVGNKHWKLHQFKEAIFDPLTWAFFLFALIVDIPNGGLTSFFALLIKGLGYNETQALLYSTPGGAVGVVTLVAWGILTSYVPNSRILLGLIGLCLAIIGASMLVALPSSHLTARLAGYYLVNSTATSIVAVLSLISTNVAGYTKKTTVRT